MPCSMPGAPQERGIDMCEPTHKGQTSWMAGVCLCMCVCVVGMCVSVCVCMCVCSMLDVVDGRCLFVYVCVVLQVFVCVCVFMCVCV